MAIDILSVKSPVTLVHGMLESQQRNKLRIKRPKKIDDQVGPLGERMAPNPTQALMFKKHSEFRLSAISKVFDIATRSFFLTPSLFSIPKNYF